MSKLTPEPTSELRISQKDGLESFELSNARCKGIPYIMDAFGYLFNQSYEESDEPIYNLSSGRKSKFYFDVKKCSMNALILNYLSDVIIRFINHHCKGYNVTIIGGPTMGSDPLATATSIKMLLQYNKVVRIFSIRKEAKKHGSNNLVVGPIFNGDKAILLEDVVTTGASAIKAANILTSLPDKKIEVVKIISLIDREEGGQYAIAQAGYDYESIFKRNDFQRQKEWWNHVEEGVKGLKQRAFEQTKLVTEGF